ncbi:MAG TPA: hypothetical protein VEY30_02515 [Myxococcaceae bacterium]|nr:hypothetical protein [Myxococcaceae bacterium]
MTIHKLPMIEIGYQLYLEEGGLPFGAVREVAPGGRPELLVNIENAGDFTLPLESVKSVHDQKVVLDKSHLSTDLRQAIRHAHDGEAPGL